VVQLLGVGRIRRVAFRDSLPEDKRVERAMAMSGRISILSVGPVSAQMLISRFPGNQDRDKKVGRYDQEVVAKKIICHVDWVGLCIGSHSRCRLSLV